ncbi:MAG: hypothetical protein H0V30_06665 [Chitinophagaceae bacterium]|nr:hypothetical protein [Chitinophagaceae bacterium]
MKTSNKILIGLLITIFAVPFLIAASLKSKINNDIFTVEKNYVPGDLGMAHKGTFTEFKFVKVIAPRPEMLTCHLKQSEKMDYQYFNDGSSDSLAVYTTNDTLYIQYISQHDKSDQHEGMGFGKIVVEVNLPVFDHLTVDGAEVIIASNSEVPGILSVLLKNYGSIKHADSDKNKLGDHASPTSRQKETGPKNEIYKGNEDIKSNESASVETLKNASLKIANLKMREVLVYHLLNKI